MDWQARLDELLYAGESVRETVDGASGRIVITSHRVLVFTPNSKGKRFWQVDRPNVVGVKKGTITNRNLLNYTLRFGVVGILLFVIGLLFDFATVTGSTSTDFEDGDIGILGATEFMIDLFARLNELLLQLGVLLTLIALVLGGLYWYLREPVIVISVAGDDPNIDVPWPEGAESTVVDLEHALFSEAASSAESSSDQEWTDRPTTDQ